MKLDRDLVRDLLFYFEKKSDFAHRECHEIEIEGYSAGAVAYALLRMHEAGLITGETIRSKTTPERIVEVIPCDLTFKGHEFLDSVRDPAIWKKTKEGAKKIGGISFELVWELAKAYGRSMAKERLGVDL